MAEHSIAFRITEYGIDSKITCHQPAGAPCHCCCPVVSEWACEQGVCEHEQADSGRCLAADPGSHLGRFEDCYVGPTTTLHDGPIEFHWDGDGFRWWFEGDKQVDHG